MISSRDFGWSAPPSVVDDGAPTGVGVAQVASWSTPTPVTHLYDHTPSSLSALARVVARSVAQSSGPPARTSCPRAA